MTAVPKLAYVTSDISALISRLDDPSADIAEDAKEALIGRGTAVIPELAAGLVGLYQYGKLSAIEVFPSKPRLPVLRSSACSVMPIQQSGKNVAGARDAALLEAARVQTQETW